MNRLTILFFILTLVAIGGGATWYLVNSSKQALAPAPEMATSTPEVSEGLAIYTNGTYGLSVFYPQDSIVSYSFEPSYHLGTAWRANALPDVPGSPIVSIVPYSVQSEDSYPRYFNAMIRIGASEAPEELERCLKPATEQNEIALPDADINGTTWKAFSFESAGMMQYASGISYRTIHEGKCVALEQVRTGSIYREAVSSKDIPEETLQAEYAKLDEIVRAVVFAR